MENENKKITLDETAFIIGSGPSLNKIDMSLIKDLDTFGMNRQYIAFEDWGFEPKYYCIIDRLLVREIFKTDVVNKFAKNPECTIEKFFISNNYTNNENKKIIDIPANTEHFHGGEICKKIGIDKITKLHLTTKVDAKPSMWFFSYGNCGMFATNLAYMLGYKRAVLLGMDCRYGRRNESIAKGEDLEHFHPNYFDPKTFSEGKTHGPSDPDGGLLHWHKFIKWMGVTTRRNGIDFEIISSSPDSSLHEFIEYVPLEDVLNGKV